MSLVSIYAVPNPINMGDFPTLLCWEPCGSPGPGSSILDSTVFYCTQPEKCMTSSNTHHGIELLSLQHPWDGFIGKRTFGRMLAISGFGSKHFEQRGRFWYDLAWWLFLSGFYCSVKIDRVIKFSLHFLGLQSVAAWPLVWRSVPWQHIITIVM